jgi:Fe-S cluster assembly protein SufD
MPELMDEKDVYLESFAASGKARRPGEPAWLHELHSTAIDRFAERGFPTLRDEEWRFTNLTPLLKVPFQPAATATRSAADLDRLAFDLGPCSRLVFVNGRYDPRLSVLRPLPDGVVVGSLAAALGASPDLVRPHLARHAAYEDQPFAALNTAFIEDGAFVHLPKGKVVAEPVHVVFVSTAAGGPSVSYPRTLVLADVNSQLTLVESYVGPAGEVYFTDAVTEIVAGDNAVIDHYKVQRESTAAFHLATMQVRLGRSANLATHNLVLGGGLVRNDVGAYLGGEGGECTLNGLYAGAGRQLIDNHTRIDHAVPHCTSHELYKGILDGQARGVFSGRIYVHPDAQKTDAKQTNKTLLLSPDAVIDSKPQLEIFADDVKCTHGATIGQLDAEGLFYLRSRGIGRDEARSLLTFAFANDVVGRVKVEPLRARLEEAVLAGRPAPEVS